MPNVPLIFTCHCILFRLIQLLPTNCQAILNYLIDKTDIFSALDANGGPGGGGAGAVRPSLQALLRRRQGIPQEAAQRGHAKDLGGTYGGVSHMTKT